MLCVHVYRLATELAATEQPVIADTPAQPASQQLEPQAGPVYFLSLIPVT